METMHEIIPFAKEMLSQRRSRATLKIYLVGTMLAVFGTILGLIEIARQTFTSDGHIDAELMLSKDRDQRSLKAGERGMDETEETTIGNTTVPKKPDQAQRIAANRLHAS
ncbi:G0/G1 switch protein 2 [Aplochiton taeniatus]